MIDSAPEWLLDAWFSSLDGLEFQQALEACEQGFYDVEVGFDRLGAPTSETAGAWEELLLELEAATTKMSAVVRYIECRRAVDTDDAEARASSGTSAALLARYRSLGASMASLLSGATPEVFEALVQRPALWHARQELRRHRAAAATLLAPEFEAIASELRRDGASAWSRLYQDLTGSMKLDLPGGERVPLAWRRSLLEHPNAERRQATLDACHEALKEHAGALTAALNAISGTRTTLQQRRGPSVLDASLQDFRMDRATLNAMHEAVATAQPISRRFLEIKAELLGMRQLGFADLRAPLGLGADTELTWDEGKQLVLDAFGAYRPELADFARRMFDEGRVEAAERPNKRSGAFCSTSKLHGNSMVFMTWRGTLGDVRTLAHELGHAFHGHVMGDLSLWEGAYPMTLAETASIFAEGLVEDHLLASDHMTPEQEAGLLAARLGRSVTYLLDIPMRFGFERQLYDERGRGEWTTEGLCQAMRSWQCLVFGDVLDPTRSDPWFWASKLHFFMDQIRFYNYPYTFGYAFSAGVSAHVKRQTSDEGYATWIRLLRATGGSHVEEVAAEALGVDLRRRAFWDDALAPLADDLARFEAVHRRLAAA